MHLDSLPLAQQILLQLQRSDFEMTTLEQLVFQATTLAFVQRPHIITFLTMKKLLILTVLTASSLLIVGCKSPKGNIPAYGFQTSRPSPLQ
jgi:hypothetical protein